MAVLFQVMYNHLKIPGKVQRWIHQIKDHELLLKDKDHFLGDKWLQQVKTLMIKFQHKLKGRLLLHLQEEECQSEEGCQMDKKLHHKMMQMKFKRHHRIMEECAEVSYHKMMIFKMNLKIFQTK